MITNLNWRSETMTNCYGTQTRDPEPVLGHSFQLWATNTKSTPVKNLVFASIPIIIHNYKNSLITNIQQIYLFKVLVPY